MAQRPTLTTEAGAPVIDNQNSQTSGASGPVLLQDHYLIESWRASTASASRSGSCTRWVPAPTATSR